MGDADMREHHASPRKTVDAGARSRPSRSTAATPAAGRIAELQQLADASDRVASTRVLQRMADSAAANEPNRTGLPDRLKAGIEAMSGVDLSTTRVHFNSPEPARIGARAFARGDEIHLGPEGRGDLPHEAWHLVQQAQGRVPPTGRIGGLAINDDPALEREADIAPARARRLTSSAPTLSATIADTDVLQPAGHAGVMIFSRTRLLKRVEINEYREFGRLFDRQNRVHTRRRRGYRSAIPWIYGVYASHELDRARVYARYGRGQTVQDWLGANSAADHFIEIQNLGGEGIEVRDFKIGTATADRFELARNYGMRGPRAARKRFGMAIIDRLAETSRLGLRDSDEAKNGLFIKAVRGVFQNILPTLQPIVATIAATGPYNETDPPIEDLDRIAEFVANSQTVYIASSLILRRDPRQQDRSNDRIVLIDLAHPIRRPADDDPDRAAASAAFEAARRGMLLGIANLRNILLGRTPSRTLPSPMPPIPAGSDPEESDPDADVLREEASASQDR